jgi:hypothetical protein
MCLFHATPIKGTPLIIDSEIYTHSIDAHDVKALESTS